MSRTVLDDILEAIPTKKKKVITKERVIAAAKVATQLLSIVVLKRPALAPLQGAVAMLLAPSSNADGRDQHMDRDLMLSQIKELKDRLATADTKQARKLKAQINTLYDLLT